MNASPERTRTFSRDRAHAAAATKQVLWRRVIRPKHSKSRALARHLFPPGSHRCKLSRREALHGCNASILRADPCSWQHRGKRASSGAERPIHNYYDMAAAVASDAASGDSMAAAAPDASGAETERRWEAFAPHLPHAFADGDRVFVMKSRGGQRGSRPFAAAVVRGEATEDGRRTVVYKDGSTYAARPEFSCPSAAVGL